MKNNTTNTREALTYLRLASKTRDQNNMPLYLEWLPLPCSTEELKEAIGTAILETGGNLDELDVDGGIAEYWIYDIMPNVFAANALLAEAAALGEQRYKDIDNLLSSARCSLRAAIDQISNRSA